MELPDFPRTRHLPHKANAQRGDLIVSPEEASVIFSSPVEITEKVDGANVGIAKINGQPVIRNRNHILNKGFHRKTAAKMQFSSIWGWWYENEHLFDKLLEIGDVAVYGEWMVARHSVEYDKLSDWFMAFDLYDFAEKKFYINGNAMLREAGFCTVPIIATSAKDYEEIEALCYQPSAFSSKELREGLYFKVGDDKWVTDRFKMVRRGFIQGEHWSEKEITKNKVAK